MAEYRMQHRMRPAGGLPLIGMMVAVAVVCLGSAAELIGASEPAVPSAQLAALPSGIKGLGELPLPPVE